MKIYFKIVLIIIYSLISFSCADKNKKEASIKLYNEAINYNNEIAKERFSKTTPVMDYAYLNKLLNEAIKLDSSNYKAYTFKMATMNASRPKNKKFYKLLRFLDIMSRKFPDKPDAIFWQGQIYDKIGKKTKADSIYNVLLKKYNQTLSKDSNNSVILTDRVKLYLFLYGKEKAIEELNRLIKIYPEDNYMLQLREEYRIFSKEDYLEAY
jgi:tetratricopeptide (TPR) repeat protein